MALAECMANLTKQPVYHELLPDQTNQGAKSSVPGKIFVSEKVYHSILRSPRRDHNLTTLAIGAIGGATATLVIRHFMHKRIANNH